MTEAEVGDTVKVAFKGKLNDGTVFDATEEEPMEFVVGDGTIIPAFENAVVGMSPEETKTISIPSEEAYGEYQEELVQPIKKEQVPEDVELEVGQQVLVGATKEDAMQFTVADVKEDEIILDGNHPLAGQDLNFEITLVEVSKKEN
jgi:FKBP-type peptidyl-prolyl cis-trans isomerase 2